MSASPELRRAPLEALPAPPIPAIHVAGDRGDDEGCSTPTAAQFKIPALAACPPAPKKARISAPSCRRRLLDADLFVRIRPEDVERLFRPPAPPPLSALPAKKRKRREFELD